MTDRHLKTTLFLTILWNLIKKNKGTHIHWTDRSLSNIKSFSLLHRFYLSQHISASDALKSFSYFSFFSPTTFFLLTAWSNLTFHHWNHCTVWRDFCTPLQSNWSSEIAVLCWKALWGRLRRQNSLVEKEACYKRGYVACFADHGTDYCTDFLLSMAWIRF